MSYRRRASPLHAARVAAAIAWFVALGVALLTQSNPLVLGALAATVVLAARFSGVAGALIRVLPYALALAAAVCVINALVSREGLTVIWRFGDLPVIGETNLTLEAVVYGAVLGLRAAALVSLGLLYTLTVDPDRVLALMRRFSFRSALTASVATRMLPVLIRDGRRRAEAQRCRVGGACGRLQLLNATTAGVLDRALDVAATLELRGYSMAGPTAAAHRPWSRHDLAFVACAAALAMLTVASRIAALAPFDAYPSLRAPFGPGALAVAFGLGACALLPFAERRGVEQ